MRKSKMNLDLGSGERFIALMKKMGIANWELAEKLGITPGVVSRYRSGEILPGTVILKKFFTEFGLSINWLLFGHGPEKIESIDKALKTVEEKETRIAKYRGGNDLETEQDCCTWCEVTPDIKNLLSYMQRDPVLRYDILTRFHKYKLEKAGSIPAAEPPKTQPAEANDAG